MGKLRHFSGLFPVCGDLLHRTHRQLALCRLCRRFREQFLVGDAQQRPCVSGAQAAVLHQLFHLLGQFQQPQGVCHSAPGFSHTLCHFLLGQLEHIHQLCIGVRLFHRVQILPLEILDQGDRHSLLVGQLPDHHRHFVHAQHSGSTPPALAVNDLIVQSQRTHQNGLYHAVLLNGIRQRLNCLIAELFPGLIPVGFQF